MTRTANRIVPLGLLLIVALMPFHAFLSVWLGSLIGHKTLIQAWKEVLIIIMLVVASWAIYKNPALLSRLKKPTNYLLGAFIIVSLVVTLVARPELRTVLFGLKTDIEFLVIFVLSQLVTTQALKYRLTKALLMSSGVVIAFGLLQAFVLPRDFLANFGYGPNTIQPFLTVDPVLHSFRILSTLGGPNQLGSFLILPICLVVAMLVSKPKWWHPPFLLGALVVEWFTYSRSALLGLIVAVGITLILGLPKKIQILVAAFLVLASILGVIAIKSNLNATNNLQYYVLHGSVKNTGVKDSTDLHLDALHSALTEAGKTPLGRGLGAAGPASFHSNKPDITENYYLQLAIETGLVGLVLFVGIITATGLELIPRMRVNISAAPVLGALVGISIVNLFLHGWADSSTALTFWAYAGAIIGART